MWRIERGSCKESAMAEQCSVVNTVCGHCQENNNKKMYLCVVVVCFPFFLKCSMTSAMSVGGPWPAVWSLINTALTQSSETGATSHTNCCKIMSRQQKGITYCTLYILGEEGHFLSPNRIYSNEMRGGGHPNWLDLSQREGETYILLLPYMHLAVSSLLQRFNMALIHLHMAPINTWSITCSCGCSSHGGTQISPTGLVGTPQG